MAEEQDYTDILSKQNDLLSDMLVALRENSENINTPLLASSVNSLTEAIRKETTVRKQFTDNLNKFNKSSAAGGGGTGGASGQSILASSKKLLDTSSDVIGLVNSALGPFIDSVGNLGFEVAESVGLSRQAGVQLVTDMRSALEIFTELSPDTFATIEQQLDVINSVGQQFTGVRAGLQFSGIGLQTFATQLNTGFGAPFNLTKQSLDSLIVAGISTSAQMEQFRRATGRSAITSEQFTNIVGRNSLSFLLFGDKIAKSIVDFDRVGVNIGATLATQEGIVGNLEGTLDAVNQLNMLGARIDFEQLVRLSELGTPAETFQFLLKSIPPELLKSTTSFRLLAKAIPGLDPEALLRAQEGNFAAAESIERTLTEPQRGIGLFARGVSEATQKILTFPETFPGLTGKSVVGTTSKAVDIAAKAIPAPDLISGYGERTLVTPSGTYALKNNDTVIAGTKLFSEGSVNFGSRGDSSGLQLKLDRLISILENAKTTVNIDGTVQSVPRVSLAGVYLRNERA